MTKAAAVLFLWGSWPLDIGESVLGICYVEKLVRRLRFNTTEPIDVICFVDSPYKMRSILDLGLEIDVRMIPRPDVDYRWNFRKLFMFDNRSGLYEYGWVVALDLDMAITGSIDFLFNHRQKELMTCRAAYADNIGGSIVGFDPSQPWVGEIRNFLESHLDILESNTGGSERKFYRVCVKKGIMPPPVYWQVCYPRKIFSYKMDDVREIPEGSAVIRFHGEPRPHQISSEWMNEYWKGVQAHG